MHLFSHQQPLDYVDPGRRKVIQDAAAAGVTLGSKNVIDPSIKSTLERMEDFESQINNSPPTEKALKKFMGRIGSVTNFDCPNDAIDLSKKLRDLKKSDYPKDHAGYYFQQFIPRIEFELVSGAARVDIVSLKLNGNNFHPIPRRQKETKFAGKIEPTDVQLIGRTDRDADLFVLKIITEYKSNGTTLKSKDQLSSLYALWDTYSPVISEIINYPKRKFNLDRPDNPEYLDKPPTKSFPGGHATATAALATLILVTSGLPDDELAPLCKSLGQAATYIATLREMAGIHFQEDSTAGLLLGFTVMQALLTATINSSTDLTLLLRHACNGP